MQPPRELPQVEAIIPVYGERSAALAATLRACAAQTHPFAAIFVIDDGSPVPVAVSDGPAGPPHLVLLRLQENQGISAARNAGLARSTAPFLACINTEVLPDPDWVAVCCEYLAASPTVGAVCTAVVPEHPHRLLTRWRMRFMEEKRGPATGPIDFATGHAVLFRREALDAVGGYDPALRLHHEDSDVCRRMRARGWATHFLAHSRCLSIQQDSVASLAAKQLRDSGWYSPQNSLARLYRDLTKWTLVRAGRNFIKARWYFLPVDAAIWARALAMATARTLRYQRPGAARPQ